MLSLWTSNRDPYIDLVDNSTPPLIYGNVLLDQELRQQAWTETSSIIRVSRPSEAQVYQCASSGRSPRLRWRDMKTIQESLMTELCFNTAIRYPDVKLRRNMVVHRMSMFLQHYLPAHVGDVFLACARKKQW